MQKTPQGQTLDIPSSFSSLRHPRTPSLTSPHPTPVIQTKGLGHETMVMNAVTRYLRLQAMAGNYSKNILGGGYAVWKRMPLSHRVSQFYEIISRLPTKFPNKTTFGNFQKDHRMHQIQEIGFNVRTISWGGPLPPPPNGVAGTNIRNSEEAV